MKNVWFLLVAICLALHGHGQAPQVFHYQGVARNAQGAPLAGTTIAIRLSIKDAPDGGTTLYSERKSIATNAFGLYSVSINDGGGFRTGDFNAINWQNAPKYLQTEIDPANGTSFVEMGTVQIQSVPFALQAAKAANLNGVENPQAGDVMVYNGSNWTKKPGKQIYNIFGVGFYPTANLAFLSQTVTVTLTHDSPIIAMDIEKVLGSVLAVGGSGLSINLGYQKNGGPITEFDPSQRLTGLKVSGGNRIPFSVSGVYQTDFLAGDTYTLGLVAICTNPNGWNDNNYSRGKIEISY